MKTEYGAIEVACRRAFEIEDGYGYPYPAFRDGYFAAHNDMQAELSALREQLEASREKQRMLTDHAVRVDTEAFRGNVDALSKLDLDAMDIQPLLLAVQNWDISTGRARELLRCWVLGTFKPDMLPACGDDLFADTEEPREAWSRLRAINARLVEALSGLVAATHPEGDTPVEGWKSAWRTARAALAAATKD